MTVPLRELVLGTFLLHADRPALSIGGERWSYGTLLDLAQEVGARLDRLSAAGEAVGIWCQRDLPSLTGILAAVLSGRPFVPMNPAFPRERLAAIAGTARPGVVIASAETWGRAAELADALPDGTTILSPEGEAVRSRGPDGARPPIRRDGRTAYAMFTSGTTGVPKGVPILCSNLLAYLEGMADLVRIGPGDRATHFFDLSFDLSVHDLFVTWLAGAELCVLPKALSMAVPEFVRENRITHWFSVPSLAAFCARLGQLAPGAMPSLRSVLFCGEALPTALAREMLEAAPNAEAWNIYGPTEATIAFTAFRIGEASLRDAPAVVPIGKPFGRNLVRLEATAEREDAFELLLGGDQVSPGYLSDPVQTAARFSEVGGTRWYRTGDLVRPSDRHGLLFLGRRDDQVKISGYRVELAEIEAVLREAAGTQEAAAVAWPPGAPVEIRAFVVDPGASEADIRARCRERLPHYMAPRKIVAIAAMPLGTSGKVDRAALAAMVED